MYDKKSLEIEIQIRVLRMNLESSQRALEFWAQKESEFRQQLGSQPQKWECQRIRRLKHKRKLAASDLDYFQQQLDKLLEKKSIYNLFS